ncbi:MAG: hypothetical protein LBF94_03335 [Puniceicoccales bacterium]|jgi:hypothetical protein|nr:hypothetical protein [Puniceicoccales bacterium]
MRNVAGVIGRTPEAADIGKTQGGGRKFMAGPGGSKFAGKPPISGRPIRSRFVEEEATVNKTDGNEAVNGGKLGLIGKSPKGKRPRSRSVPRVLVPGKGPLVGHEAKKLSDNRQKSSQFYPCASSMGIHTGKGGLPLPVRKVKKLEVGT